MKYVKLSLVFGSVLLAAAGGSTGPADTGLVIITAEVPKSSPPPIMSVHDVIARVNNAAATVTGFRSLRTDPAGLELWVMIDDGISGGVGVQLNDIKDFIRQQSPQTQVAVGYLRNGSVDTRQRPTRDHETAAKAVRLPTSIPGISSSPYIALSDFVHKLPKTPQPREVVLVSSGIDPYYGPGPQDPYLLSAIHDCQKAGVPVYTIYFASAGHDGHSYWQVEWGQNNLSELSEATGGEFYWEGDRNPVAFRPYFESINRHLSEQYLLSLDVPQKHAGFARLQLRTESRGVTLVGPTQIYLPAAGQGSR